MEVLARAPGSAACAPLCRSLLRRLRHALKRERSGVTLLLAGDREVRALNRRHRGRDRTTDVLSFPSGGDLEPGIAHLGEIAISLPQARRQAKEARWPLASELALLTTHGFLHLLGYDHESDDGKMHRLERRLLRRVSGVGLEGRALPWGAASPPRTRWRRSQPHD